MTLRFEQILADGVAQTSYLIGDDDAGVAAVIDPRPDVDVYLETARRHGLAITHVLETHIHADFMSGARELADRLEGAAKLCLSVEGGAEYGFDHEAVHDGDTFDFGAVRLTAKHTPGHTPEHLSYLLHESGRDMPWGVLTGDSFFVDSVGRPDLMGDELTEELTEALFRTVRDFYMQLDDGVIIYPCHGAGSECGPDIGDRMSSTIGYERRFNPYCRIERLEDFKAAMEENAPPTPTHYPHLKKVNAAGPPVLGGLPKIPGLTPEAFAEAIAEPGAQLLDTRHMLAFGAGHIAGALNIEGRPELSVWAGWLLDPEAPILLVLESETDLPRILRLLWRTGFVNFGGCLAGGIGRWQEEGRPLARIPQTPVHELRGTPDEVVRLDVRKQEEWDAGHMPGARHVFLGELPKRLDELDPDRTYAAYCASGFRASAAASLLKAHGFEHVRNVPGSWKAWTAAGHPVSTDLERKDRAMENAVAITDAFTVAKFEPEEEEYAMIAEEGFRSVVSLQTGDEDQKATPDEERRLAEDAGLAFYHQGVSKKGLSDAEVDRFRDRIESLPKPVLLHCSSGRRAGAMTMMHVASQQGMSGDEVISKAEEMGFECDTPELEEFVKSYVDRHGGRDAAR